jgi:hypothetical protein
MRDGSDGADSAATMDVSLLPRLPPDADASPARDSGKGTAKGKTKGKGKDSGRAKAKGKGKDKGKRLGKGGRGAVIPPPGNF